MKGAVTVRKSAVTADVMCLDEGYFIIDSAAVAGGRMLAGCSNDVFVHAAPAQASSCCFAQSFLRCDTTDFTGTVLTCHHALDRVSTPCTVESSLKVAVWKTALGGFCLPAVCLWHGLGWSHLVR